MDVTPQIDQGAKDLIATLQAQRNQALDAVAALSAEVARLQRLHAAEQMQHQKTRMELKQLMPVRDCDPDGV